MSHARLTHILWLRINNTISPQLYRVDLSPSVRPAACTGHHVTAAGTRPVCWLTHRWRTHHEPWSRSLFVWLIQVHTSWSYDEHFLDVSPSNTSFRLCKTSESLPGTRGPHLSSNSRQTVRALSGHFLLWSFHAQSGWWVVHVLHMKKKPSCREQFLLFGDSSLGLWYFL